MMLSVYEDERSEVSIHDVNWIDFNQFAKSNKLKVKDIIRPDITQHYLIGKKL